MKINEINEESLFVDSITSQFSAQKLIESTLHKNATFAYWGVMYVKQKPNYNFFSLFLIESNKKSPQIFTSNWDLIEFLVSAPEPPVYAVMEGKPIY